MDANSSSCTHLVNSLLEFMQRHTEWQLCGVQIRECCVGSGSKGEVIAFGCSLSAGGVSVVPMAKLCASSRNDSPSAERPMVTFYERSVLVGTPEPDPLTAVIAPG